GSQEAQAIVPATARCMRETMLKRVIAERYGNAQAAQIYNDTLTDNAGCLPGVNLLLSILLGSGTNQSVQPANPTTGATPVSLTFAQVTQAGTASLAVSDSGPTTPTGMS